MSSRKNCIIVLLAISAFLSTAQAGNAFQSSHPNNTTRTWIGPEYWANPMEDWQLNDGRIECISSGGDRNVYLLTRELSGKDGTLDMSVTFGQIDSNVKKLDDGYVGFKIGIRGEFDDYRDSAVRGDGFRVGMFTGGRLFIGKYDESVRPIKAPFDNITLKLTAIPNGDKYSVSLTAYKDGKDISKVTRDDIDPDWLVGGVALVCSRGKIGDMPETRPTIDNGNWGSRAGTGRGGNVKFWFKDWMVGGSKVDACEDCTFGPILFNQYTLSNKTMKMTAQMPPVADSDSQTVDLETRGWFGYKKIATAKIDKYARTATFKIDNWKDTKDTPYRLAYQMIEPDGKDKTYYLTGTVRKDPVKKKDFVVAAFTGNNDLGFPNNDFVKSVTYHNPDMLFFSGDQIYEGVGGYGVVAKPLEKACNNYLRKWYLYGWAYKDLLNDRPSIAIPDDHDVYHGNIWGAGGKATGPGGGAKAQDSGGYKMQPEFVNMVQRTQTSHMPDAYDPTPVLQDIGVYYCNMNYGGVSFAVIEDRKFKSAPAPILPDAKIWNGWPQNPDFNAKETADVAGAVLLGDRQLKFLNDWAADWNNGIWMKTVLSQTIFANVATLPEKEMSDAAVPSLRILNADEYPADDLPVSDFDSNGWPQTGRNNALKEMRKAFAFHIAGDQHLGSTIQYGIDEYRDSGFAVCVPSVSNVWPRRWYPKDPSANPIPGQPRYTGDFEEGFGNKVTVHAVSNPLFTGLKPARLYDRATGYGIVRFNRDKRDITIEIWPRLSDPAKDGKQYPGWPITITQADNYGRKAFGYLPTINVKGMTDAVVQVIDEQSSEIVYTVRIDGRSFAPKVFADGKYTVKVGEPDAGKVTTVTGLEPTEKMNTKSIEVKF